ncbi:MAG: hypothetical protein E5W99_27725, partial [Mesorhizobium sp.]
MAGIEHVIYIRPQSLATEIDVSDKVPLAAIAPLPAVVNDPILAVLDGVPMAGHPLLRTHLSV